MSRLLNFVARCEDPTNEKDGLSTILILDLVRSKFASPSGVIVVKTLRAVNLQEILFGLWWPQRKRLYYPGILPSLGRYKESILEQVHLHESCFLRPCERSID